MIIDQENLLLTLKCAVGVSGAVYVSGPITTGRRFVDWFLHIGYLLEDDPDAYKHALQKAVIQPNESDILTTAELLRVKFPIPVIEPASLKIISWNQTSYYQFWEAVIKRYIARLVAMDGWQFSVGCAIEFQYAIKCGIPVETVNGESLSFESGSALMLDAALEIERINTTLEKMQRIANRLRACAIKDKI